MKVSVIIPTRNAEKYLERLFETLKEQSVKPDQILVVDSSSNDGTPTICGAFGADLIKIGAKTFDHGGTRNLAASMTLGEILVFMTQDALFNGKECLKDLINPLENPTIGAAYGRQVPKEDANPVERFVRAFNYPSGKVIKGIDDLPRFGVKTFFFSNACSAIKNSVFKEVGGFPEKTIMNEDMFLAAKLLMKGYKIAYQPDAVVCHSHNYSLPAQFKRYFDIGVFFARNRWIKNLTRPEGEGVAYLKKQLIFLSHNGQKSWIPYALADTMTRFLGYRIGLSEKRLPLYLKRMVSHNKGFWEGQASYSS